MSKSSGNDLDDIFNPKPNPPPFHVDQIGLNQPQIHAPVSVPEEKFDLLVPEDEINPPNTKA